MADEQKGPLHENPVVAGIMAVLQDELEQAMQQPFFEEVDKPENDAIAVFQPDAPLEVLVLPEGFKLYSPFISIDEIERAKRVLHPRRFEQEFEASWEDPDESAIAD